MEKIVYYKINASQAGRSVEEVLRSLGYSKNLIIHLRRTPLGITCGGELVYTTHKLLEGQVLTIRILEEESSSNIIKTPMELSILYEDDDLMVINKQANVPIHPSQGNYGNTLANGIAYYFEQKHQPFVFRAVNRLDRDTSGLLIIAKHMLSACLLYRMAAAHDIHREYLAAVAGKTPDRGTITAPIARAEGSTIERIVDAVNGDYACTHYVRTWFCPEQDFSVVRLTLETGRTHQIRVHMKHIGHPLLGDFLYHSDYRLIRRQALHSAYLSFTHPLTGQLLRFQAPLPEDMSFCSNSKLSK